MSKYPTTFIQQVYEAYHNNEYAYRRTINDVAEEFGLSYSVARNMIQLTGSYSGYVYINGQIEDINRNKEVENQALYALIYKRIGILEVQIQSLQERMVELEKHLNE